MIKPIASTLVIMSLLLSSSVAYSANPSSAESARSAVVNTPGGQPDMDNEHREPGKEKREKRHEERKEEREAHHEREKAGQAGEAAQGVQ